MGKRLVALIYFLFSIVVDAEGQTGTETLPRGARSLGLGNTNVTLADPWSIFNNVSGLVGVSNSTVLVGYDHRFNMDELSTLSAALVMPLGKSVWGLGASSFGSEYFSQQQIGLGFANKLGITSIGIKINYFQTSIEGGGTGNAAILNLGGMAELTPVLHFGAYVYNIGAAKYGRLSNDKLPTVVKAGLSFRPSTAIIANLEAEKDILLPPLVKVGLEYNFIQKAYGRVGINSESKNLFFGIGFNPEGFGLDYAMVQHAQLGNTHHVSLQLNLSGK
jgi:hypothetical protein